MPKEPPILFNGEMVRAILDGRKTETRRVIKLPFENMLYSGPNDAGDHLFVEADRINEDVPITDITHIVKCPYKPGDRLWVRETWQAMPVCYDHYSGGYEAGYPYNEIPKTKPSNCWITYRADGNDGPWRPSIHMPRWASRILLEVDEVRVERVQDITEEGAKAEGVTIPLSLKILADYYGDGSKHRIMFEKLWDSCNAKHGWDANPWVRVVKFHNMEVT